MGYGGHKLAWKSSPNFNPILEGEPHILLAVYRCMICQSIPELRREFSYQTFLLFKSFEKQFRPNLAILNIMHDLFHYHQLLIYLGIARALFSEMGRE